MDASLMNRNNSEKKKLIEIKRQINIYPSNYRKYCQSVCAEKSTVKFIDRFTIYKDKFKLKNKEKISAN